MFLLQNSSTDPYYNLAFEEYFLKNFEEDFFFLWRNRASVIVGRNQNTLQEINSDYLNKRKIPVVRRMSGGGAVFHDLGNINFTLIKSGSADNFGDYAIYTAPMIAALRNLNITAVLSGRNDLLIDGKKFSGNAQYIWKKRILHHGTLLFSSSLANLSDALTADKLKIESKGIQSVASRVTNISEHLSAPLSAVDFMASLYEQVKRFYNNAEEYIPTLSDKADIRHLAERKYATWDWNFGYSPPYTFGKKDLFRGGLIESAINVQNGMIVDLRISGDYFSKRDVSEFVSALKGQRHNPEVIRAVMEKFQINDYFAGVTAEELLSVLC